MMLRSKKTEFNQPSGLYDQDAFYQAFVKDLRNAKHEVIIESPFISIKRIRALLPLFGSLAEHRVKIYINTRDPIEHNASHQEIAAGLIASLQNMGVTVLYTVNHHRKLAIIDGCILWEGSLNILSYYDSCEIMRRFYSEQEAYNMKQFIGLDKILDGLSND